MERIRLNDLAAVRDLGRVAAAGVSGGYYSLLAGAALATLAYRNRRTIYNRLQQIWNTYRPRSSNCVRWYDGEVNCY